MKKVLKTIFLLAALVAAALTFASCDSDDEDEDVGLRVALVAHSPDSILDDGSFNQGANDGIIRFLNSQGLPMSNTQFFQPHAADDATRIEMIEQAVAWGADVLVLPGFQIADAVNQAQSMFPDVTFIILDAEPATINSNVIAVYFAEHESGFLAGYAAVREGFTQLGFMGGHAIPPVVRFGHGFLLGAEHAANQMGLSPGDITVIYQYLATFAPSPEVVTAAGALFVAGTEVIFAAAGGAGNSVMAAAEGNNGFVIGVDSDQSGDSTTVITSAIKTLDTSVFDILAEVNNGTFQGGRTVTYDASMGGVALAMASSRFNTFTNQMYTSIFNDVVAGAVHVNDSLNMDDIRVLLNIVNLIEH